MQPFAVFAIATSYYSNFVAQASLSVAVILVQGTDTI